MAASLTRAQRRAVAGALIDQAGTLVEFWGEYTAGNPALVDVAAGDAAEVIAGWLARLPGDAWDTRLPDPTDTTRSTP